MRQKHAPQRCGTKTSATGFDKTGALVEPDVRRLRRLQIDTARQRIVGRKVAERLEQLRADAQAMRFGVDPDHAEIVVRRSWLSLSCDRLVDTMRSVIPGMAFSKRSHSSARSVGHAGLIVV